MDERHPEDCLICRARALNLTKQQAELITEALTAGIAAGWKTRGLVDRIPTGRRMAKAMMLAHIAWAELFGTLIPESAEVRAHRHREH